MIEVKEIFDPKDLALAFQIRREVFVLEQNVAESEEFDEYDPVTRHFLGLLDTRPCGTARIRKTEKGIKLERFAVLSPDRNLKMGKALVERAVQEALLLHPPLIYLHAQVQAKGFYEKLGFTTNSEPFLEAGIEHIRMFYSLDKKS
jgi:predicted GNAT family N-acyltransferase